MKIVVVGGTSITGEGHHHPLDPVSGVSQRHCHLEYGWK